MKQKIRVSTTRLIQRRDAWLKKLGELGPMTRGSLVTARRGNQFPPATIRLTLTPFFIAEI